MHWLTDEVVTLKRQTDLFFFKSVFKESENRHRKTSGGREVDRHEEKAIKPGFRQAFMGSQTQTPFEVVKRFWAYNSDNTDWRKTAI